VKILNQRSHNLHRAQQNSASGHNCCTGDLVRFLALFVNPAAGTPITENTSIALWDDSFISESRPPSGH
jgi:hypothetical protein